MQWGFKPIQNNSYYKSEKINQYFCIKFAESNIKKSQKNDLINTMGKNNLTAKKNIQPEKQTKRKIIWTMLKNKVKSFNLDFFLFFFYFLHSLKRCF